jgi:putative transcriptional regulator
MATRITEAVERAATDLAARALGPTLSFGEELQVLRRKLGLTQQGFANKFGLSRRTIQNWEQGHKQPETAARLLIEMIKADPTATEALVRRTEK